LDPARALRAWAVIAGRLKLSSSKESLRSRLYAT
jgi:hypothetical protein